MADTTPGTTRTSIDVEHIVTEDDAPVDDMLSEDYVVYDPFRRVSGHRRQPDARFPELGLGLTIRDGTFEDSAATWLRWTDSEGNLIPTGRQRAERLSQAGIDPDAA